MSARGSRSRKPEVVIAQIPANTSIRIEPPPQDRARRAADGAVRPRDRDGAGVELETGGGQSTESVQCKIITM